MTDIITEKSFLEETRKTQDFFRTEFPPLSPSTDELLSIAVRMYVQAGSPNGTSPDARELEDKAIEWIGEMHDVAVQEEVDADSFAQMQLMVAEAKRNGDMTTDKNGVDVWTPLGMTRWLYVSLHVLLGHAEEQQRGLTSAERQKLERDLLIGYNGVVSYNKAMES
jgi:hypothetical protein